jgi:phosphoribosylaminoimidazolecarboxamide formyltransferase/IMP cyclohydrolase
MSHTSTAEPVDTIDVVPIKRALLSVFDKTGLKELAEALIKRGVELYSTGGTEKYLRDQGFAVHSVVELTNSPEILDGRVKTLHPAVHGGLLFRRELPSHRAQAAEHGIAGIDLLVVNLYPFEETVAKPDATKAEIIEQIDIGGPAMLRSAAKNFMGVALLTSPGQYSEFTKEFEDQKGSTKLTTRQTLARDAFQRVAEYDVAISDYLMKLDNSSESESLPSRLMIDQAMIQPLRYGENPHQKAALYGGDFKSIYEQLWGKELSHINMLDLSAASQLIAEWFDTEVTVAAIFKHTTPCGVAEGSDSLDAFERAFRSDPESPFGGVVVLNQPVSAALAERLNAFFSEIILAPDFDADALDALRKKKDRRLIRYKREGIVNELKGMLDVRSIIGGTLVQEADTQLFGDHELKSITQRPLSAEELRELVFAWKCVKHVKSNAIVYAGSDNGYMRTLGIGGGQTSRVESSRLAVRRAAQFAHSLKDSVVASDAYFPFADGLTEAIEAGSIAVIQPGGSIRDHEVIAEAEKHNVSMVLTGMRHFRH